MTYEEARHEVEERLKNLHAFGVTGHSIIVTPEYLEFLGDALEKCILGEVEQNARIKQGMMTREDLINRVKSINIPYPIINKQSRAKIGEMNLSMNKIEIVIHGYNKPFLESEIKIDNKVITITARNQAGYIVLSGTPIEAAIHSMKERYQKLLINYFSALPPIKVTLNN